MSTKLIKEENNLFTAKNIGCVIAMLFVLISLTYCIIQTNKDYHDPNVMVSDYAYEELLRAVDAYTPRDIILFLIDEDNYHNPEVAGQSVYYDRESFAIEETDTYGKYVYVIQYPNADGFTIFNKYMEVTITKMQDCFDVSYKIYRADLNYSKIDKNVYIEYNRTIQPDIHEMFKFINE